VLHVERFAAFSGNIAVTRLNHKTMKQTLQGNLDRVSAKELAKIEADEVAKVRAKFRDLVAEKAKAEKEAYEAERAQWENTMLVSETTLFLLNTETGEKVPISEPMECKFVYNPKSELRIGDAENASGVKRFSNVYREYKAENKTIGEVTVLEGFSINMDAVVRLGDKELIEHRLPKLKKVKKQVEDVSVPSRLTFFQKKAHTTAKKDKAQDAQADKIDSKG